jgi:hypothetical protein
MRKRKPWHGDRWSPVVDRFFERRLRRRAETLARIVGLDDPTEISGMMEELETEIRRTWSICLDVNRASSDADVRHALADLLKKPEEIGERVWQTDPNARGLIEDFAPGSHPFLEQLQDRPAALIDAVERALSSLPRSGAGHPGGVKKPAERHLSLELARIFQKASCREPTRRHDSAKEIEYGPFHDFVAVILDVFPRRIRGLASYNAQPAVRETNTFTKLGIRLYREEREDRAG